MIARIIDVRGEFILAKVFSLSQISKILELDGSSLTKPLPYQAGEWAESQYAEESSSPHA
jgi:hypothetical protein